MRRTQALFVTLGLLAAGCTTASVSEDSMTTTTSADTTQTLETTTTTVAPTTTSTEPPTTTTEAVVLDFSQIAGKWSGTGVDGIEEFSIEAEIQPSAELNRVVAYASYVGTLGISQEPCHRVWRAEIADPPAYELKETNRTSTSPCPPGTVILEYHAETDTIAYQFLSAMNPGAGTDATGTLHRAEP